MLFFHVKNNSFSFYNFFYPAMQLYPLKSRCYALSKPSPAKGLLVNSMFCIWRHTILRCRRLICGSLPHKTTATEASLIPHFLFVSGFLNRLMERLKAAVETFRSKATTFLFFIGPQVVQAIS